MTASRLPLSSRVSFIGFAAIAIGIVDAAVVAGSILGAAHAFQYVPVRMWAVSPLCWLAVALVAALACLPFAKHRSAEATTILLLAIFVAVRLWMQPVKYVVVAAVLFAAASVSLLLTGRWWMSKPRETACVVLGVVATLLACGVLVAGRANPRPSNGARSPAEAPDVVVAFLDTVSFDAVFGAAANVDPGLPFLSRMARDGVVFERAYTPSPWTLPAHLSAVTGIPGHQLGIGFDRQEYVLSAPTLAERFRRRGYRTAAVISNTFLNEGSGFARGFDTYEHASNALDVCRTAPGALIERWSPWFAASVCNWDAPTVTSRAIRHLRSDDRPLFLLLNYMDAHDPYYVGGDCSRPVGAPRAFAEVPPGEYRARYYPSYVAAIRCIDRHLATLESALRARGRGTVLAVLSDHGEQFGENGLVRHGNSLYKQLLHVPLVIRADGVSSRRVAEPVSIEVLPQLLGAIVDGGELSVPRIPPVATLFPPASAGGGESWSVIEDRWQLIQDGDSLRLFDLAADHDEARDLAKAPSMAATVARLSSRIAAARRTLVDPRSKEFRSLGYIR